MRNTFGARFISACLAILLTLTPTLVFADVETAQQYYRQASEAYQNGDLERAADLLERAYAEDPNLVYQYNRILALKGLGKFKEAMRVLEIYENPMMDDDQQRFTDVQEIKSDLEKAIAEQEANRAKDGDGKDGDGKDGDGEDGDKDGDGEGGDGEDGDGKTSPPPAEGSWVGYTLLGAGAVTTGLGVLFASGALVSEELDRASCASEVYSSVTPDVEARLADCGYTATVSSDSSITRLQDVAGQYDDDVDAVGTQKVLAGVFIGTGAALLVTGFIVWLVDSGEQPTATANRSDAPKLQVAPYVSQDGFGGALKLTF